MNCWRCSTFGKFPMDLLYMYVCMYVKSPGLTCRECFCSLLCNIGVAQISFAASVMDHMSSIRSNISLPHTSEHLKRDFSHLSCIVLHFPSPSLRFSFVILITYGSFFSFADILIMPTFSFLQYVNFFVACSLLN